MSVLITTIVLLIVLVIICFKVRKNFGLLIDPIFTATLIMLVILSIANMAYVCAGLSFEKYTSVVNFHGVFNPEFMKIHFFLLRLSAVVVSIFFSFFMYLSIKEGNKETK